MEESNKKPLTLDDLVKYSQEILFPFMKETFVGKKEFDEFKDDMMNFKDEALQKLEVLTQERTVGDEQDKRQKEVLKIHNTALKDSKILSKEQTLEINKLRVF